MTSTCARSFNTLLLAVAVLTVLLTPPTSARADEIAQSRLDAVTASIQQQIDGGKLAGAVTLVAQHGEIRQRQVFGYRDLENEVPMTEDTIFRIFSMTKPIAGTALMILHDEGRFELSDPVEKYIPEFAGLRVAAADGADGQPATEPARHPMTVRELMNHSAGLTYGFFSQSQVDDLYKQANVLDRNSTLKDMIGKLREIPLWAQPGTRWHYSVAVDVQGYLVEVLSGMTFDTFLRKKIFQPLAMHDTAFYVPAAKADRLSRYYGPDSAGKLVSTPNAEYLTRPKLLSGGGGLVSTAHDYLRFAQMHLNGGELDGVRILSEGAVQLMRSNQLPEGVSAAGTFLDPGNGFGLDFSVVTDSAAAFGQPAGNYYWWGIAGTWFWIDPVNELVFVGMIQTRDVRQAIGLQRYIKGVIYGD